MRKEMPASWQRGGLVSRLDTLDRPSDSSELRVPTTFHLDGDYLRWWWRDSPNDRNDAKALPTDLYKSVLQPNDLLTRFVELRNGTPEEILRFAKQWGTLGGELGSFYSWAPHLLGEPVEPAPKIPGTFSEPLDGWVKVSKRAYSILNIAAKLHQDKLGEASDWASIKFWIDWKSDDIPFREAHEWWMENFGDTVAGRKSRLTYEINTWLSQGNVNLRLEWADPPDHADRNIRLSLRGREGLFGLLAVQLVLAVARSSGLCTCSSCGTPYAPRRRPNPKNRNYCPQCRDSGVPQRDAARDYYNRRRKRDGERHGS